MLERLQWRQERAGLYRSLNFTIARSHNGRAFVWTLTNPCAPGWSVEKPTLHECQSIAASCAQESSLIAAALLEDGFAGVENMIRTTPAELLNAASVALELEETRLREETAAAVVYVGDRDVTQNNVTPPAAAAPEPMRLELQLGELPAGVELEPPASTFTPYDRPLELREPLSSIHEAMRRRVDDVIGSFDRE